MSQRVAALFNRTGVLVAEVSVDTDPTQPTNLSKWPGVIVYCGEAYLQSKSTTGVYEVTHRTFLHS